MDPTSPCSLGGCMGTWPPSITPFFSNMSTKEGDELFKLEDNVGL